MFLTTRNPTYCQRFVDKYLAALTTVPASALLVTPKVHLWSGTLVYNPTSALSLFTGLECNFTGYAAVALSTLVGPLNTATLVRAMMEAANFELGSPGSVTQVANGYWVDAGSTVDWVIAETFPAPVPFAVVGDFLQLSVLVPQIMKFLAVG